MVSNPDGFTIFCDDIRQEVGNKQSLMGIYSGELVLHQPFPVTMPKMGFHVIYREDIEAPPEKMTLSIYLPGDPDDKPTYRAEIDRSAEPHFATPADIDPGARRTLAIDTVFGAVTLKSEGKIKVRMLVNGQQIKLGTLRVKRAEQVLTESHD